MHCYGDMHVPPFSQGRVHIPGQIYHDKLHGNSRQSLDGMGTANFYYTVL